MKQIYRIIRLNRFVRNHRVKFLMVWFAHFLNLRHLFLRLDPIMACNLSCAMCYFSDDTYRRTNKGVFSEEEIQRIATLFFKHTVQLIIGCGTEPTLYRDFIGIIELAKKSGIPFVGLTTNGQLLTEASIQRMVDIGLDEITLSLHGVHRDTYESLMVNASYDKFHEVLWLVEKARERNIHHKPHVRINYTVNSANLEELSEFFTVFGRYSINTLQIRPIMNIGGRDRTLLRQEEHRCYLDILSKLSKECERRHITLLANTADPSYTSDRYSSVILTAVKRYISPQIIWMTEFQWKTETLENFYRRIHWRKQLLRKAMTTKEQIIKSDGHKFASRYDVFG